jgi:predicted ATP-dependent protease
MNTPVELPVEALRRRCDPKQFTFETTTEVAPLEEVIGQKRAVEAIQFGLQMKCQGYNIFVSGLESTGKTTTVRDIVTEHARSLPAPSAWCMVNNFEDPFRPLAVALPAGRSARFARTMRRFVEDLQKRLPKAFQDEAFRQRLAQHQQKFEEEKREILKGIEAAARDKELQVARTPAGFQPVPLQDGKPMTPEAFGKLPEETRKAIEERLRSMAGELEAAARQIAQITHNQQQGSETLMREMAATVVDQRMSVIHERYGDAGDLSAFLDAVKDDIVGNVEAFVGGREKAPESQNPFDPSPEDLFARYRVNILVERKASGAPVVFEPNPTFRNVFGWIEKRAVMGAVITDFSMVQAGSLLQANGGFLILEMESILMNPLVWEALKRALQNKQLFIEDVPSSAGFAPTASLRPEPIPLDVKVILLGSYQVFQALQNYDAKFNKIFKVRADFDHETELTDQAVNQYAGFIARVCKEGGLMPFTADAVAAVVEYGCRFNADQTHLSLRFGPIVGLLKEADHWARSQGDDRVDGGHVARAVREHRFRYNLYEEKMQRSYHDNTIMIDITGREVGQVNALAVYQMGDISFGRPNRITCETWMGEDGIINIEREARMSGSTHDKGVLILSGFMGRTFAQHHPLNLTASLTFEQNYGGIDGDSASSTELYALLSSLADLPLDQGIAVTGSVNQKGRIQAIGGVNEKIEGFFDVCQDRGLSGDQGVMIPQANVKDLMIKSDVLTAVAEGRFHIWPVVSIAQGIELLTGVAAGEPDTDGRYPADTVFGRVQKKLLTYYERQLKLKKKYLVDPKA